MRDYEQIIHSMLGDDLMVAVPQSDEVANEFADEVKRVIGPNVDHCIFMYIRNGHGIRLFKSTKGEGVRFNHSSCQFYREDPNGIGYKVTILDELPDEDDAKDEIDITIALDALFEEVTL